MIILDKDIFTIGEFVQKSGVSIRTLRYYDSIDLLKPSDYTDGGHRLYSQEDLRLLQKIKALQFLGLPLKDIKTILEKQTVEGEILIKSLTYQKKLFEAKKVEIANIISDLNHLIKITEAEEIINVDVFCSMLQKLIFEEDTEKWLKENDFNDHLFNISKQEEINLDKKWSRVLTKIKQLSFTKAIPSSKEAQETIEILLKLIDETAKGNLDSIKEKLPFTEPISFPNPFTEKELEFLQEAINCHQNNNSPEY
ncbi:MerR family transcriptional regulator [Lysinibacillus pakistanensis]|uniref:MerR family transcriptional regulator n=1 Tax=Lysinibacillus pakistanensis TaxID=759811 RepID=A0AAX3WWX2_9BACI|nr:MerR family transcriptional regulator [Lysinibacillus pakistanensis]MDM5230915.1 MerR family transcriptional regulator [Lysinibacillus pakistanensis]WHY46480.1 MerR family transcriptional regulator [Lysinibacillus pakistanensis]WHY51493.1 MerR family transcriptional regulator [Lysinibacillus pakistanensis]